MCGRAAQTYAAVQAAAGAIGADTSYLMEEARREEHEAEHESTAAGAEAEESGEQRGNYNLSPGMEAVVFWKDERGQMRAETKVWGLVPRGGSQASPLAKGMSQHFSNLMFNARTDTLFEKPTFARLAGNRKTCLIAVDGFFEWKTELKGSRKQPYYVYGRKGDADEHPYLLLAGLWTSVKTGRSEDPPLDTFTILTTEACSALQWLHPRMPLMLWDEQLALRWLERPSERLLRTMDEATQRNSTGEVLSWHAVTPDMTSTKFRSADAIKAIPKVKTIKSFFQKKEKDAQAKDRKDEAPPEDVSLDKRQEQTETWEAALLSPATKRTAEDQVSSPRKKKSPRRKGPIDAFLKPSPKKES
jgi:putative SOS response-associated peptidase YedK